MTSAVSGDNVWRLSQLTPPQLQWLIVHRQLRKSHTHLLQHHHCRQLHKKQLKGQQLQEQPASETNQYQHRSHYVFKSVQSSLKVSVVTYYPTNIYENVSDEDFENFERSQEISTNKQDNALMETIAAGMVDTSTWLLKHSLPTGAAASSALTCTAVVKSTDIGVAEQIDAVD